MNWRKFFGSLKDQSLSSQQLNLITAVLIAAIYNTTFYQKLLQFFSQQNHKNGILLFLSVGLVHIIINYILLSIFAAGRLQKITLAIVFLASSGVAYFTNTYGVVIDNTMILNVLGTDKWEVLDLFTFKLLLYVFFLGIVPTVIVSRLPIQGSTWGGGIRRTLIGLLVSVVSLLFVFFASSNFYASFFREHKALRYYINPIQMFYSVTNMVLRGPKLKAGENIEMIGKGAEISKSDTARDLVIFVLGETARAQNFSLNGYKRLTNPLLSKENVVSLSNMYSCGTSTAVSVPCMFSIFGREAYTHEKFSNTENLADVLSDTNQIDVLWRDNNSNSKGVATRVTYQDFKTAAANKVCDTECRDVGMLDGLQEYINSSKKKDIFIVLHQMGNHGPAYYKRYPREFEVFKPTCQTSELQQCTQQEIINTYDNAILYTDYFLHQTIQLLKANDHNFETALIYVSDHGESLGEHGIYLHGLPYGMAPEAQRKVGAIFWFGQGMHEEIDTKKLKANANNIYNHDFIFHSLLGLFEVETPIYDKNKDLFH